MKMIFREEKDLLWERDLFVFMFFFYVVHHMIIHEFLLHMRIHCLCVVHKNLNQFSLKENGKTLFT